MLHPEKYHLFEYVASKQIFTYLIMLVPKFGLYIDLHFCFPPYREIYYASKSPLVLSLILGKIPSLLRD